MALALVDDLLPNDGPRVDFDSFLTVWAGKRIDLKLARMRFNYLHADDQLAAIEAAVLWRPMWLREEWRYLPNPKDWLNNERWTDEPPRDIKQSTSAHVAFAPDKPLARGEMPDHVKALIAKLKVK